MLKLKQYFCKHDFKLIAEHPKCRENLWKCNKCGVYYIQHYWIGIGYKCKDPSIYGWNNTKEVIK